MLRLCISIFVVLTSERITARQELLRKILTDDIERMNLKCSYTLFVVEKRCMGAEGEMWTTKLPTIIGGKPSYGIFITVGFLATSSELTLEHGAVHELSHIKRGDLEHAMPEDVEIQTEKCVYDFLGEERYFAFWKERGLNTNKTSRDRVKKILGVRGSG